MTGVETKNYANKRPNFLGCGFLNRGKMDASQPAMAEARGIRIPHMCLPQIIVISSPLIVLGILVQLDPT